MPYSVDKRVLPGSIFLSSSFLLSLFLHIPSLSIFILILFIYHISFFRDPRPVLAGPRALLSPAEGLVVDITEVYEPRFLKGDAVKIGIFLSLFDAHVNRAPMTGRIEYKKYEAGRFFNAMKPIAARENECVWLGFEHEGKKLVVRAISGAIARRICCDVNEKQDVTQGAKLGIICYGSRTELYVPKNTFRLQTAVGQKVKVGQTVLGEWLS